MLDGLIVFLVLLMLVIVFLERKVISLKKEKQLYRDGIKMHCHDFKTSLATLRLIVDAFKDYERSRQENGEAKIELSSLIDVLEDLGGSIASGVEKLSFQGKSSVKMENFLTGSKV